MIKKTYLSQNSEHQRNYKVLKQLGLCKIKPLYVAKFNWENLSLQQYQSPVGNIVFDSSHTSIQNTLYFKNCKSKTMEAC